jgi:endonuclease/exonuclease/phosphatase family metal-dependent hydrolase
MKALEGRMMFCSWRVGWLAALLLGGLAFLLTGCPLPSPGPRPASDEDIAKAGPGSYLFCFWNVENLFDDVDDDRHTRGDHEPDAWFSTDKAALETKLDHLCKVLLPLNGGRGPDILAVAEIESGRAAELLQQALNKRLRNPALHYKNVLFEEVVSGRHIAPAIITRLPVEGNRTHLLGRRLRILEGRVKASGKPLVIIASHWSSRVGGQSKTEPGRDKYGDMIYGRFKEMYLANPKIDLLVCGDFNDNPDDPSVVDHLHATSDKSAVLTGGRDPKLFDLFTELYKKGEASLYYGSKRNPKKYLFDQVCVSPGMLDNEGWSVDVSSATVVKQMADDTGRPIRFGTERDKRPLSERGASDHFPVTVRLTVR